METKVVNENDVVIIEISGRIDTNTAADLENVVKNAIQGAKKVKFDFSRVEYISSAGLRIVLATHKSLTSIGGELSIKGANDEIMEIFDMTGFSGFLIFED